MRPSLQLKLSQHLALTPQLQQSIRLLQMSTLELEQELEKYVSENPLLEREEEEYAPTPPQPGSNEAELAASEKPAPEPVTEPSSADDESWLGEEGSYSSSAGSFDDDDNEYQDVQAATTSLRTPVVAARLDGHSGA